MKYKNNCPSKIEAVMQAASIVKSSPRFRIKGLNHRRVEIDADTKLIHFARFSNNPNIAVVFQREKINRFGKLGFVPHVYVSPELFLAIL